MARIKDGLWGAFLSPLVNFSSEKTQIPSVGAKAV